MYYAIIDAKQCPINHQLIGLKVFFCVCVLLCVCVYVTDMCSILATFSLEFMSFGAKASVRSIHALILSEFIFKTAYKTLNDSTKRDSNTKKEFYNKKLHGFLIIFFGNEYINFCFNRTKLAVWQISSVNNSKCTFLWLSMPN